MLRLGHIDFSNGFPVHALLIDRGVPPGIQLRTGVPTELNALLANGEIDVAPSSSIEFARHADRYRIFPDFAIGARGAVQSIVLESSVPPEELAGRTVAVPTASATSVVLLRALLELRLGVRPVYRWFDQRVDTPEQFAAATLRIGDVALARADGAAGPGIRVDLGAAWTEWTGLPFAFALWQISAGPNLDGELHRLRGLLLESRAYFESELDGLAERHAARFGMTPDRLAAYWRSLVFTLDEPMRQGLARFYEMAAQLGEIPAVPALRWF